MTGSRTIPSGRTREFLPLVLILVVTVALHLEWLIRFRLGYLTEWDESGYITLALNDTNGLYASGIVGLLRAFAAGPEGPLVPLATVPLHLLLGRGIFQSLLVIPFFFAVLVLATYGAARALTGRGPSFVAALAVAAVPGVTDYTRLYHFALPATAMLTAALWALLWSDGLTRRNWTILAGVFVGLMLLARTMTVAYLPGLAIALLVLIVDGGTDWRSRFLNASLGGIAAAILALPWYLKNAGPVASYLAGSGYGQAAGGYGTGHALLSWGFWTKELGLMMDSLYLPLAIILALCLAAGSIALLAARRGGWLGSLPAGRGMLVLAAVVLEGYLALTSSTNAGTAFSLPWLPALVVLAAAMVALVPLPPVRVFLLSCLIAVSLFNLIMKAGIAPAPAAIRTVPILDLGRVTVTDGTGLIQGEVAAGGDPIGSPTTPMPELERKWLPFEQRVTGWLLHFAAAHGQTRPFVVFGTDEELFSDTRVTLAAALWFHRVIRGGLLKPFPHGDTAESYRTQLLSFGNDVLVTSAHRPADQPTMTRTQVERAARSLGFREVRTFRTPDGRTVRFWWRSV